MYDPQAVQLIALLLVIGFILIFFLALFYGLFLLAKIRSQAVRMNKSLDALLEKNASGSATVNEPKPSK